MRQLWINVPTNQVQKIMDLAEKHNSVNTFRLSVEGSGENRVIVVLNISNRSIGSIFQAVEDLDSVRITMHPADVYPLNPPSSKVPDQLTHVSPRSPVEVWLNGLQSIGSWKGFLGYALGASIIVWVALYTNAIYLLIGAMLVAPFAGPAMNFALATATGDQSLMGRNLLRYFSSLAVTILATGLLSLIFQQKIATGLMVQVSELSSVSVLLPLVAGAVGALNLSQSHNNSLVPGAAVGTLIAASLAPPAGIVGMATAIGRWDLAVNSIFLLLLQLFAINLAGTLVFRFYQISPHGSRYQRGKPKWFYISLVASLVLAAGMLIWQFWSTPNLLRASQASKATGVVQEVIDANPTVDLVEANVRFTRPSIKDQNTLLGVIFVQRRENVRLTNEAIREQLTQQIQQQLLQADFQVVPLISVTVLEAP
jgi:uncharacterized hydrophobic protein (TIGR00271 family)